MRYSYNQVEGVVNNGPSIVTNDTFCKKSFLDNEQKKRRIEEVHSDGRFKHEDEYEMMKVQKIIKIHILKHVKFCKGKGTKLAGNSFEKKNDRILQYGNS